MTRCRTRHHSQAPYDFGTLNLSAKAPCKYERTDRPLWLGWTRNTAEPSRQDDRGEVFPDNSYYVMLNQRRDERLDVCANTTAVWQLLFLGTVGFQGPHEKIFRNLYCVIANTSRIAFCNKNCPNLRDLHRVTERRNPIWARQGISNLARSM